MNKLLAGLPILLVLTISGQVHPQAVCRPPDGDLLIRVTAKDTTETLEFEAAYFLDDSASQIKLVKLKTPYELYIARSFTHAMFHKLSGASQLRLDLVNINKGKESRVLNATSNFIVLDSSIFKDQFSPRVETHGLIKK